MNDNINFNFLKQSIENKIKAKGLESLYYVIFDENNSQPWAFHFFYRDGKFLINGRDERSYVMGKTMEFDNFNEAESFFINKLEQFVESNKKGLKVGFAPYYSSPLWDQDAIFLDTDKVDAIGVVDGALELLLTDPNHWFVKDEQDHLLKLQEKLNNYIYFIESKQYAEGYGDDFTEKVINLTFQYAPSDNGLAFLVQVQKVLQPTDIRLKVVVPK
ncbi:Imm59 family immunity protein [Streptococcus suis]